FVGLAATVWMYRTVPTGFIPQEDQGNLYVIVQAPPGSSLEYTTNLADRASAIIAQDPDIEGAFSVMGFSFSGGAANAGLMFIHTKNIKQRQTPDDTPAVIVARLNKKFGMLMIDPK